MKQFTAFIFKEFRHILRDYRTMLILLGLPIVEIVLFGFAISTEVKNVRIMILDPSKDAASVRIAEHLRNNRYFTLTANATSITEIETAFQHNDIDLAVIFPENFDQELRHTSHSSIQLLADGTDPNTATTAVNYTTQIITAANASLSAERGLASVSAPVITPQIRLLYNPQMEGAYNFVPGVMGLILMLICAMMTAISIVREKERGTMEVLLVSPLKPIYIILAKTVPYFVLSCINLATILLLSVFVLHVPIAGSLFWLGMLSLLFIFVALSLGMLISTVVSNQITAMLISGMVLMMPTMILSGMLFPIESMPSVLQLFSHVIPAKWYISGVRKLMIQGVNQIYTLREFAVLAAMGAVLLIATLKLFKNRLE